MSPTFHNLFLSGRKKGPKTSQSDIHNAQMTPNASFRLENALKSYQKPVITDILVSYPAIKDYRSQAYRLSYPNAKNIEVRRCRVSVLNTYIRRISFRGSRACWTVV